MRTDPEGPDLPVYLNNAATSFPKAPGLGAAISAHLEQPPRSPGRTAALDEEDPLSVCRAAAARRIGAEARQIVLCKGATEALNIALWGLVWNGETVLASKIDHNSVLRPLHALRRKGLIKLELAEADADGRVDLEDWTARLKRTRPKLAVLNHASNVTGALHRPGAYFRPAREAGALTLLDASQTLGLVEVDARRACADMIAFTGHKYALGPAGTGGLFVGDGVHLEPLFVGGTGVRSDLLDMPPEMPVRLEPGTPADALFAGLGHSLTWLEAHPRPAAEIDALRDRLERGLDEAGAVVFRVRGERIPVLSFRVPGWTVAESGFALEQSFSILLRSGLHCAPLVHKAIGAAPEGTLRASLSRFTTAQDIDYTLEAVGRMIHETR